MNESLRRTGFLLAVLTGGLTGNVLAAGAETADIAAQAAPQDMSADAVARELANCFKNAI